MTTKKKPTRKPASKRRVLKSRNHMKEAARIAAFLNVADTPARQLWNILTSLRGPDSAEDALKEATTQVIRHKFGLNEQVNMSFSLVTSDTKAGAELRRQTPIDGETRQIPCIGYRTSHFLHHASLAFAALGLTWDKTN